VTSDIDGESNNPRSVPLGGKTVRRLRLLTLIGALLDLVIAFAIVTQVPLNTTISYTRVSREWQIPLFALLAAPVLLSALWWQTRTAETQPLPDKERVFLIVISVPFLAFFTVGQVFMARDYLIAGGILPA
jgi:hypothetical protein